MTVGKVLLVEPSDRAFMNEPVIAGLAERGVQATYAETVGDVRHGLDYAEVLISNACPGEVMDRAPRLKAVVNPYTGSEMIDVSTANRRSILVGIGQTPENYIGMAEATILMMLACHYNLAQSEAVLRSALPRPPITARIVRGRSIGLIGYGPIGQTVAKRLSTWEVDLMVSAPRLNAPLPENARHVELDELLRTSDVVLVLCALNKQTHNLLSRERLETMKQGAVLVNTARGGIIDEAALADLLHEGRLGKAALDAFEVEPLPSDSPLRAAPNVILTPHMIGHNVDATEAMIRTAVESTMRVLSGRPPVYLMNPHVLDAWLARPDVGS